MFYYNYSHKITFNYKKSTKIIINPILTGLIIKNQDKIDFLSQKTRIKEILDKAQVLPYAQYLLFHFVLNLLPIRYF